MLDPGANLLARGCIPNPHHPLVAIGDDAPPVRTEGGLAHIILMLQRREEKLAPAGIPNPRGMIGTGGDGSAAIRAESGVVDALLMRAQRAQFRTRSQDCFKTIPVHFFFR